MALAFESTAVDLTPLVPRLLLEWQLHDAEHRWRRVHGTMVSADISGFTNLSERLAGLGNEGAEQLTDLINECFDGMIAIAASRGGDVLKFGGDALLVLFTGAGHAERACAAAIGMRASIARPLRTRSVSRVALKMSQGVHSGEFDLFLVDAGHLELLVVGPGVTRTVECEAAAAAGQILLSHAAAAAVPAAWLAEIGAGDAFELRRVTDPPEVVDLRTPGRALDVDALVPRSQRDQLRAGVAGEHRRVTTAFVKFAHVDELTASVGPAEVGRRLDDLAAVVRAATARHDVHWLASDVYPGGGKVILTAGAPVSSGHDEDRMLRTVREIVDADPGLDLRAGVNAGKVFAGVVGSGTRRVYTVMGDAVNLAARLMQRAQPGEVIASRATVDHAGSRFALTPMAPFTVKGKSAPIEAVAVGSVSAMLAVPEVDTVEIPLIGRDRELATLVDAADRARLGESAVIEIVAEVGAGKTRLLDELHHVDGTTAWRIRGGMYARATPYFALRSGVRALLDVPVDADRSAAGTALRSSVARLAPDLLPLLPLVAVVVDAEVPSTREVDELAPAFRRARLHDAVLALLAAVDGPLLVTVDDAHWLDEASTELLDELARRGRPGGLLTVLAREPDAADDAVALDDAQDGGPAALALDLTPLDRAAARRLAIAAAGADLLPDVVDRLVEHAGGRPLFVIELARSAADGDAALPDSIESLVTARIDTLDARARVLLREASVLGSEIDVSLAADAFATTPDEADDLWRSLDRFVVAAGPGRLRFRHSTYRTVAYEGLPYRRRRELHDRIGRALERRGNVDELAGLLSLHFHSAQAGPDAWKYSVRAGDEARAKYANVEAAEFYRRALDAARWGSDATPREIRDVWTALGDVSEVSARFEDAAAAYAAARRLARDDTSFQVELARKQGVVCERSGRYSLALRWYTRGLRLSPVPVPDLSCAYAGVRYRQGRWADCVRWAERAAREAEAAGDRRSQAHAWYLLDIALSSLGSAEAAAYRGRALPVFEELGDLVGQANALNNDGVTAYYESRWHEAIDCYERSRRARDRAGDVVGAATQANNLAEVLADQGHLDEARALFEEALGTWRAARYPVGVAVATSNLGRTEARAGRTERAVELLGQASKLLAGLGATALVAEAEVRTVEALVLAGRFDEALDRAEGVAARLDRGEGDDLLAALLDRSAGVALLRTGRVGDARARLEASLARATALDAAYEAAVTRLALAALLDGADPVAAAQHRRLAASTLGDLGVVDVRIGIDRGVARDG